MKLTSLPLTKTREVESWQAWFESIGLTLGTLLICFGSNPNDPFYLHESFPWPIIGPILASVRYGFYHGLISSLVVIGGIQFASTIQFVELQDFPFSNAIGLLLITMIIGEFRDIWGRKLNRLQEANAYRQLRLDEFTRNFHLLKVSHDRLEQRLVGSSLSLRESLVNMRKSVASIGSGEQVVSPAFANKVLALFAEYGSIQQAGFYVVSNLEIEENPIASLGSEIFLQKDDGILQESLGTKKLVSIRPDFVDSKHKTNSQLLAAIPLVNLSNQVIGIVVVHSMPFFAFQDSTLKLLILLAGHLADLVDQRRFIENIEDESLSNFALNLHRTMIDAEQHDLSSHLFVFNAPSAHVAHSFSQTVNGIRRGLDVIYEYQSAGHSTRILALLPLTEPLGAEGYLVRLDEAFKNKTGQTMAQAEIQFEQLAIENQTSTELFLKENVNDEHLLASLTSDTL